VKYYLKKNSYPVKFDLPNGNDFYFETINAKELRTHKSLEHSKIEPKLLRVVGDIIKINLNLGAFIFDGLFDHVDPLLSAILSC
jgi:hypothetical protein